MIRLWNKFRNIGVKPDLPARKIRNIRLLNGILATGEILFLLLIIKSVINGLPQEYSIQLLGAFLFLVPVGLNYLGYYRMAKLLCLIIPILYLSFLSIYWGSGRGSQLIILAVAGLSVLFYEKRSTIIILVVLAFLSIVAVEIYNIFYEPLYIPPNVEISYLINLLITVLMIVTIMGIFKKENDEYEDRISGTNKKITHQHQKEVELNRNLSHSLELIHSQKAAIDEVHERLQDSINYAQTIQQAILTISPEVLKEIPEHFIFLQAKNIVSGDFYYLYNRGSKVFVGVVDCTGHGVPGAFMSMIGHSLLQEAVETERQDDPGKILSFLNKKINHALKQSSTSTNDGMDVGLIVFDKKSFSLEFAGAKIHLILFNSKGYRKFKGEGYSIGGYTPADQAFCTQKIQLAPVDMLYMYTDGYQDQFGGNDNKKYRSTRLIDKLFSIQNEPMEIQKQKLIESFEQWKGNNEQTDDVLVFGMRV